METLLAVTLFAIVVTCSYGVFSMGIQIWKRTTGTLRYENKVFMVLERMQSEIQAALPVPKVEELILKQQKDMTFEGDEKSFLFPAILQVEDREGKVSYQYGGQGYAWNPSDQILCRQTWSASDFLLRKKPSCKPILKDVLRAEFEYLVPNAITKSHSWYRVWKGKDGIPRALRFVFEIASTDRKASASQTFTKTFWIPVSDLPMDDFGPGADG